ncbi:retrotransposon hot spot (RHS) protein, partial [Trypanosoma cruzi]
YRTVFWETAIEGVREPTAARRNYYFLFFIFAFLPTLWLEEPQRPTASQGISVSICNCAQQSTAVIDGMCIHFGGNIAANSLPLHLPPFFLLSFWMISESGQRPRRLFSVVSLSVSLLFFLPVFDPFFLNSTNAQRSIQCDILPMEAKAVFAPTKPRRRPRSSPRQYGWTATRCS